MRLRNYPLVAFQPLINQSSIARKAKGHLEPVKSVFTKAIKRRGFLIVRKRARKAVGLQLRRIVGKAQNRQLQQAKIFTGLNKPVEKAYEKTLTRKGMGHSFLKLQESG